MTQSSIFHSYCDFVMDNLTQQIDEIEALMAIYGDDWRIEDEVNRAYSMNFKDADKNAVKLYLKLPDNYPSTAPPSYELSAPHLNSLQKQHICNLLEECKGMYSFRSFTGQNVIFQWIERIREELLNSNLRNVIDEPEENIDVIVDELSERKIGNEQECSKKIPIIYHGEVLVDRKSSFQGHAAQVSSVDEAKLVLKQLLEMKKIEQATHNMYAYRIYDEEKKNYFQDCADDGESQAGGRLLHFLQIVDVKNIIVIVSRWYGGIHLGPDRFRHINNAARQVLEASNLISRHKDQKK